MSAPAWCEKYVGIPFADLGRDEAGCDCWGLVRLVFARELAVPLPDYSDGYTDTRNGADVAAIAGDGAANWHPAENPRAFDVVLLRVNGLPRHVGLVAGPGCLMLHTERGKHAAIENYSRLRWASRIEGFYRYDA